MSRVWTAAARHIPGGGHGTDPVWTSLAGAGGLPAQLSPAAVGTYPRMVSRPAGTSPQ